MVTENNNAFIDRIPHQDETYSFDIFYHAERVQAIEQQYFKTSYRAGSVMTKHNTEKNAMALLKVHRHFAEHQKDIAPGREQIKSMARRICQVIMKNNSLTR